MYDNSFRFDGKYLIYQIWQNPFDTNYLFDIDISMLIPSRGSISIEYDMCATVEVSNRSCTAILEHDLPPFRKLRLARSQENVMAAFIAGAALLPATTSSFAGDAVRAQTGAAPLVAPRVLPAPLRRRRCGAAAI